jgi:hypothetical protein
MITKRKTKNKQEIRKRLIKYNYELEYKVAVKKGLEIFNDKIVGETWTREVNFIITKCDFNWTTISVSNYSQTFCECIVFNINSTCYYRASIYFNQKTVGMDISEITDKIKRSMIIIEDEDVEDWKIGTGRYFTRFKGKVTCVLFDSEFHLKIIIPIQEERIHYRAGISNENHNINEDYDWKDYSDWNRENFNALTDGQYGDFDDFDGDWDRLDDWRGA